MGHQRGQYEFCSPNDVVNASQSTNDAYPCAIHMAMFLEHEEFLPHLKIAKEASETGRGVYELVLEHNLLTKEQLDKILRPENMLKPIDIKL